jgi:hypothetical protein
MTTKAIPPPTPSASVTGSTTEALKPGTSLTAERARFLHRLGVHIEWTNEGTGEHADWQFLRSDFPSNIYEFSPLNDYRIAVRSRADGTEDGA